jgi:hypothetical protein
MTKLRDQMIQEMTLRGLSAKLYRASVDVNLADEGGSGDLVDWGIRLRGLRFG